MRGLSGARSVVVGALLAAAGCSSVPARQAEMAPVWLHGTQTGARERCGTELIREVQRANDLTWAERIGYTWSANRDAEAALADEQQWRQRCIDRLKTQGYEVVAAPAAR